MSADGWTYAQIARALRCSEREAKRLAEAAVIRRWMHLQMGLEVDAAGRVQINAATRKATRNPASRHVGFRLARRIPDRMDEDQLAWLAPWSRSPRTPARAVRARHLSPPQKATMEVCTSAPMLVEEFEKLPPGDRWAETLDSEISKAIEAAKIGPRRTMFPDRLIMVTADVLQMYSFYVARCTPPGYGDKIAKLHARALESAPEMAPLFRSPECREDVAAAARSLAFGPEPQDVAAAEATAAFEQEIARQLSGWTDLELAAAGREFLGLLALVDRQVAARAKHQAAQIAAAELAAAKRREAEEASTRAVDEAEAQRLYSERLRAHGLPETVTSGPFYEQNMGRCRLLATARRRLSTTPVDALRTTIGESRGLFGTRNLASSIGDASVDDLMSLLRQLDAAEGRRSEVAS